MSDINISDINNNQNNMTNQHSEKKRVKILCIDGGGMRGLSCIPVLEKLEQTLGKPLSKHFDLIVGTSAGSIIATAISINMPLHQMYDGFSDLAYTLDSYKQTYTKMCNTIYNFITSGYILDDSDFKKVTDKHFKDLKMGDIKQKLAIVTTTTESIPYAPFILRNYDINTDVARQHGLHGMTDSDLVVGDALFCSCKIPLLLKSNNTKTCKLYDGGLLCNNPALIAIMEAKLLWPDCEIDALVSIGCGKYDRNWNSPNGMISWAIAFLKSSILSDISHIYSGILIGSERYVRIDPIGYGDIYTLETNKNILQNMIQSVKLWINENEDIFNKIYNLLLNKII
jgi:hypothetical protein